MDNNQRTKRIEVWNKMRANPNEQIPIPEFVQQSDLEVKINEATKNKTQDSNIQP